MDNYFKERVKDEIRQILSYLKPGEDIYTSYVNLVKQEDCFKINTALGLLPSIQKLQNEGENHDLEYLLRAWEFNNLVPDKIGLIEDVYDINYESSYLNKPTMETFQEWDGEITPQTIKTLVNLTLDYIERSNKLIQAIKENNYHGDYKPLAIDLLLGAEPITTLFYCKIFETPREDWDKPIPYIYKEDGFIKIGRLKTDEELKTSSRVELILPDRYYDNAIELIQNLARYIDADAVITDEIMEKWYPILKHKSNLGW